MLEATFHGSRGQDCALRPTPACGLSGNIVRLGSTEHPSASPRSWSDATTANRSRQADFSSNYGGAQRPESGHSKNPRRTWPGALWTAALIHLIGRNSTATELGSPLRWAYRAVVLRRNALWLWSLLQCPHDVFGYEHGDHRARRLADPLRVQTPPGHFSVGRRDNLSRDRDIAVLPFRPAAVSPSSLTVIASRTDVSPSRTTAP